jgi:hypothetical protein
MEALYLHPGPDVDTARRNLGGAQEDISVVATAAVVGVSSPKGGIVLSRVV